MSDTSIVDDEIDPPEFDDAADDLTDDREAPEPDTPEDEPEPDEAEPEPAAASERPARRPASEVIRETKRRAKEAEQANADLRREMAELRQLVQQPRMTEADIHRAQQAEQERLALMSPEERADYRIQQMEQRLRGELQTTRYTLAEKADKDAFRLLTDRNPLAKKYAAEVEAKFQEQVRIGKPVERELILQNIVGQKMLERAVSAGTKQGRAASARVSAATSRATRAADDTGSDRGRRGGDMSIAEFERKYGNVEF